jgi:hypothetical protein
VLPVRTPEARAASVRGRDAEAASLNVGHLIAPFFKDVLIDVNLV